jgi:hypothetical protein
MKHGHFTRPTCLFLSNSVRWTLINFLRCFILIEVEIILSRSLLKLLIEPRYTTILSDTIVACSKPGGWHSCFVFARSLIQNPDRLSLSMLFVIFLIPSANTRPVLYSRPRHCHHIHHNSVYYEQAAERGNSPHSSSADFKNAWSSTSPPSYILVEWCLNEHKNSSISTC